MDVRSSPPARACASCGKPAGDSREVGADFLARHVCPHCGQPQPLDGDPSYFEVFGAPCRFKQDRGELERRFYAISRALHPDRFSTQGPESRRLSLERMSLVNQAYQTLKDPVALRLHILERSGLVGKAAPGGVAQANALGPKAQVPVELAESWFDLQDALMEDPELAKAKLEEFQRSLAERKRAVDASISELERLNDESGADFPSIELLKRLAGKIQDQSYLQSMERDVERIKTRVN